MLKIWMLGLTDEDFLKYKNTCKNVELTIKFIMIVFVLHCTAMVLHVTVSSHWSTIKWKKKTIIEIKDMFLQ